MYLNRETDYYGIIELINPEKLKQSLILAGTIFTTWGLHKNPLFRPTLISGPHLIDYTGFLSVPILMGSLRILLALVSFLFLLFAGDLRPPV
jgi:hypothetical protein